MPGAPRPGSRRTQPAPARPPASPQRLLVTVGVLFILLFLFLRTFLIEPFGVPTGSMAPTLIGNHREGPCPRCGYPVRVGLPSGGDRPSHFHNITCPNCGQQFSLSEARSLNGDRLLVDKNVYQLRNPRRWEVAVFRCVYDLSKPYVKRVIGLPGEVLAIDDGDVYTIPDEHAPRQRVLLRKSLAEVRETLVPVFDMAYPPAHEGWGARWLVYPPDQDGRLPHEAATRASTADASVVQNGGAIVLDGAASPQAEVRLEYRHWNLDTQREEAVQSGNSYDGPVRRSSSVYPVHDFYLWCEVEVERAHPEGSFACRLFDGADAVAAEIDVRAKGDGQAHLTHDRLGGLSSTGKLTLKPGRRYTLEFAFVDRRATLAVDGRIALPPADLPAEPVGEPRPDTRRGPRSRRGEVSRPLQLGVRGCRVVVRDLKLCRDIHYTMAGHHGTQAPARLGPNEYFMLGDNSGNSQDSREWPQPGVPQEDFIGKPILIHQPLRLGRVTIGGRERVIQTLDWSRVRWLH